VSESPRPLPSRAASWLSVYAEKAKGLVRVEFAPDDDWQSSPDLVRPAPLLRLKKVDAEPSAVRVLTVENEFQELPLAFRRLGRVSAHGLSTALPCKRPTNPTLPMSAT
jgi:hypothetical protein